MSKKTPRRHLLAELISWASFPPLVATVFFTFLVFWYAADFREGLRWIVFISPFLVFVPLVFFAVSLKLGWVSDLDMSRREERPFFLSVFIASLAIALVTMYILGIPTKFVVYVLSAFLVVAISSIITLFWKISFHTSVITSVVTAIVILGGMRFWWMFLLIIPVAWGRVVLNRHTVLQVLGGAIAAFLITTAVFASFGFEFFF